jgi:hypothetical protein
MHRKLCMHTHFSVQILRLSIIIEPFMDGNIICVLIIDLWMYTNLFDIIFEYNYKID